MESLPQVQAARQEIRAVTTKVDLLRTPGSMAAYLTIPDAPRWKSAVIVVGDGPGIDEHTKELCRALAREGHAAVAPDLLSLRAGDLALTSTWTRGVDATLSFLRARSPGPPSRFGIVGFGVGGFVALLAGARCQLGAAISFYGEGVMRLRSDLGVLEGPKPQAASLLCLVGALDDGVRAEDLGIVRERLTGFRMPHSFVVYPKTKGNFFFPGSSDYRPAAAEDAWRRVLSALESAPRQRFRFRAKRPLQS